MYQWKQTQHQIMYGFVNFAKGLKYNYQSHMERCKAYKDHLKSNCIDDEFKRQLQQDILNVFTMVLDALKHDGVNVDTNKNIKKSYSFRLS